MKGNVVSEMRKVVKTLMEEGYNEDIFAISISEGKENSVKGSDLSNDVFVQVSDYNFDAKDLSSKFSRTYSQANRLLRLAKSRYGNSCKAINSLICDEIKEVTSYSNGILRIDYLNI